MRNIVLYQYDSNEATLTQMGKCVLSRESNQYDGIPDEMFAYAVTTTPPKKQMLVAPNPGEVIDINDEIYRVWFDEVDPKMAVQSIGDYIMSSVIDKLDRHRKAIDDLNTKMENITKLIGSVNGGVSLISRG